MQPIDFMAFAADCTVTGKITMLGERLTDFLNGQERFRVHHLECESLADGHRATVDSLSLERNDLLAVVATGPRGNQRQRVTLETNRLQVAIGPYLILGRLHSKPGVSAVASVMRRDPMIPLTHATIAYEVAGSIVARDLPTIIVNRLLVDWISPTTEAESLFPDVPIRSPFAKTMVRGRPTAATA